MPREKPYTGTTRKLVLAIDIGTTYSGVSYSILTPGEIPKVLSINRFPGQEGERSFRDTKIPTVIYYDGDGNVCAVGAEALTRGTKKVAEKKGWILVEWFKLRLHPGGVQGRGESMPEIWISKSVVDILADFLTYLFQCAKDFISDIPLGRQVLGSNADIEFVLSHPNAWGGKQQRSLRRAAALAGLIPDTQAGHARIHFVTEGEANLHFCIVNGLAEDVLKGDNHIMIVDAGGGTIDLSTYVTRSATPIKVVESSAPGCLLQGSTFVNTRARSLFQEKMKGSLFAADDLINAMVADFEKHAKPTFRGASTFIDFGSPRDTDIGLDIDRGVLSLEGRDIAQLFRPSIIAIQDEIRRQCSAAASTLSRILLVGGFANSPFLRSHLQSFASREGLALFCPGGDTAKAVAEGALWYHLDRYVSARIARDVYGTSHCIDFIPSLPDHAKRRSTIFHFADGSLCVPDAFSPIVSRGTLVEEEREFRIHMEHASFTCDRRITTRIICYRGTRADPEWLDEEPDQFSTLCYVQAHMDPNEYTRCHGKRGPYFSTTFDVVILFGLTEMKAQLCWNKDGKEQRGPAILVDDDDTDSAWVLRA